MKKLFPILFTVCVMLISSPTLATNWHQPELTPLQQFFINQHVAESSRPPLTYVNQNTLPQPYTILLTQPLMTVGIANYYQRTPMVRPPLYTINNVKDKIYARAIVMIIDNDGARDDAIAADKIGASTVVELGLININIAAIPTTMMEEVLHSQIPFGALLKKNNIKTRDQDRHYFKIACDNTLSALLNCTRDAPLYGRTNTLVNNDNGLWVAQVVEILTGIGKV